MKDRKRNKLSSSSDLLPLISLNKCDDRVETESPEMLEFRRLLAQYKAKMFEQNVYLFQ